MAFSEYLNFNTSLLTDFNHRPVVPGGAWGGMAPPDFGTSVNPISTRGADQFTLFLPEEGRLCPPITTGPPKKIPLPALLSKYLPR